MTEKVQYVDVKCNCCGYTFEAINSFVPVRCFHCGYTADDLSSMYGHDVDLFDVDFQ